MSLVLSHETALSFHACPDRPHDLPSFPPRAGFLPQTSPNAQLVTQARISLEALGIDSDGPLHVLVANARDRRSCGNITCHVHTPTLPPRSLLQLGDDIYVCDIRLSALQAATLLDELELIEFLYGLCGSYEENPRNGGELVARPALTTVDELQKYAAASKHARGADALKSALRYVRDGARSPMETAFVMMLVLPKRLGGLNIRSLKMNHRVEVPQWAQALTRRSCFYFDAYLPSSKTDLEYNGFQHNEDVQRAIDEERKNALSAMGYNVLEISKHSFLDRASFARFTEKLLRVANIRASRLPEGFYAKQELLRQFVLRRYFARQVGHPRCTARDLMNDKSGWNREREPCSLAKGSRP